MALNMDAVGDRKNESLTVVRGGVTPPFRRRLGRRPGARVLSPAESMLEREMKDVFVTLKGADGTTPSRGIAAICCAQGATPWRALGLRVVEASAAGASDEDIRKVGVTFLNWIDRMLLIRRVLGRPVHTVEDFPRAA